MMYNFAEEIERKAGGRDRIIACVIGLDNGCDNDNPISYERGKVMDWDKARSILDYSYCQEEGPFAVHTVYVWTDTSVLFVVQSDGFVLLEKVPRIPVDCEPCDFSGF